MQDFEKLGAFYLGRLFDADKQSTTENLLLYDAKDLTTHAVCVGMTGSGKTGLCLALLEEAAIDGIPAIAIDPKGDIGNLLLSFPELRPADFRPWVDPAAATRAGMNVDEFAKKTATQWREGLAAWGQQPDRIARFRSAADVTIYTPGSQAGVPLTVLRSFAAPDAATLANAEALRDRITSAVSGLLALLGVDADPLRSREHILLANILERAWREGKSVDLGAMIREIQSPPFDKVGYLDLESFFPAKDRFALAMSINNLLASPGFAAWTTGEPLDVQRLLFTSEGKPRISIISIAHLSDAERMFFVTILLGEMVTWMRKQSGTSSLRAILYMDEVFGFLPPTANPPSKTPMLTLLKQARAFGLGLVLATQNPVDLDYKALSNAGTWFLGRLQTERDKARVLDGLEGASAAAGISFDRGRLDTLISGLRQRVFLLNNVHEDEPVTFESRWALSYLRGPLTRDQIAELMKSHKAASVAAAPTSSAAATTSAPATAEARPVLPPDVPEVFLPVRTAPRPGESLIYEPALLGAAKIHFANAKAGVDAWESLAVLAPAGDAVADAWTNAEIFVDETPETESQPDSGAKFAPLPAELARAKTYAGLAGDLRDHLYRSRTLTLWKCPALKQTSQPGDSEADFRAQLAHGANERRDLEVEKLRAKYAPKLATLTEQIRKAQQRVETQKSQTTQQTFSAVLSMGQSLLAALLGRKVVSSANIGRAGSAARAAGRVMKERGDVGQAEETVEALQERLANLEAEFAAETAEIQKSMSGETLALESTQIKPKKSDIDVAGVTLAWQPFRVTADGKATPAN